MQHGKSSFRRSAFLLVGMFGSGAAFAAHAQAPAGTEVRLRGVVIDAVTYTPVEDATVTWVGSDAKTSTSSTGVFELDVNAGAVALHVTAPGHSSIVVDLEVHPDRPAYVQVPLPTIAVTLSELLVQARGDDDWGTRPARTAAELVAQMDPRLRVNSGQVGQSDFDLSLRLATSFTSSAAPTIVVDGVTLSRGDEAFAVLDRISAADVEDVQLLRGPSAAFLYPMAANGVILVTTKRGAR